MSNLLLSDWIEVADIFVYLGGTGCFGKVICATIILIDGVCKF